MLVLSRREGEALNIGEDVKIVIVEVKGKQVKIGIEAPATVHIKREELRDGKTSEGRNASQDRKR